MRFVRMVIALVLVLGNSIVAAPAQAEGLPVPGPCHEGTLPSGALSLICVPQSGWNGDLVVFAHGYVGFNEPLDTYHLTLPDGPYLPDLVQNLGFAFATTSYRQNGLTVLEGADDIRELVMGFHVFFGAPGHTYITGVSEGGLITTKLVEESPELFSGGLAACGPIGSFQSQINYFGDFRVLFDYYFPGVLPDSAVQIPQQVIDQWDTTYVPAIVNAIIARPEIGLANLIAARAAFDDQDPSTIFETTINVLWYNVFGTNDANAKMGGNPYGNRQTVYTGVTDNTELNEGVQRFDADPAALQSLMEYETTGNVTIPLVTIHTVGDEVIPYWHQVLYQAKAQVSGRGILTPIPVFRYGHCNFTSDELLGAFLLLVLQVTGQETGSATSPADAQQALRDFERARTMVALPRS